MAFRPKDRSDGETFQAEPGTRSVGALTMVFKLAREAEKQWRRLRGYKWIPFVIKGEKFIDGEPENQELLKLAA